MNVISFLKRTFFEPLLLPSSSWPRRSCSRLPIAMDISRTACTPSLPHTWLLQQLETSLQKPPLPPQKRQAGAWVLIKARKMRLTTAPELPPSNGSLMGTVGKGWGERHSSAGTRPRPIRMEAPGALPSSPLSRDDPQGQEMSLSASPQLEGYAVSEGDVRIVTATAGSPLLRGSTGCGGNRRRRKHPWRLE